ncbi:MAG: HAMP domain-containing histidine kinase [Phycisphaeraceae bacterium]|nr:HAMP domain-containing histidine kinase [Phycisphaeraceae bacterium]MCW5755419.1 HAMP domain-containing histidine kinase [Phycisphaeraceae bacterium]
MRLPIPRDISLANKCLLLFGGAVVLIVLAAFTAPWLRMNALVAERQEELARRLVDVWQRQDALARASGLTPIPDEQGRTEYAGVRARYIALEEAEALAENDAFLRSALRQFSRDPRAVDVVSSSWDGAFRVYRYARAMRETVEGQGAHLSGLVLHEQRSDDTAVLLVVNTVYLLSAGTVVLALALLVFYLITHKIILGPVRALKETAERVQQGDLRIRSEIRTGDEFEQLAETFNRMLEHLSSAQEQQKAVNRALDLELAKLAQANTDLYEANKLKAEFLANVSHELRTPLNSIVGFGELLQEIAAADKQRDGESAALTKRERYITNIVRASRDLLGLIETLLEMAKIEAGRVEVHFDSVHVRESIEGLAALIHPQAQEKGAEVVIEAAEGLPRLRTDAKRFQQIVFNFLSNAVKFIEPVSRTGRPGRITIRAEVLRGRSDGPFDTMRVSVSDTGPGIAAEHRERIFEKFYQVNAGHNKVQQGTGLGLAICRELAHLLGGEIQLVSELGRGSMFSVILPLEPSAELERTIASRAGGLGKREAPAALNE